jgi:hypothetical protein
MSPFSKVEMSPFVIESQELQHERYGAGRESSECRCSISLAGVANEKPNEYFDLSLRFCLCAAPDVNEFLDFLSQ